MDMVTDDGGGGGGGGGGGCPDDEATRRALLHMSKVRVCVRGHVGAGSPDRPSLSTYATYVDVIGSKYECALSCFLLCSHLVSLTCPLFVSYRNYLRIA